MSKSELLKAQMHLECINDAWNELNHWDAVGKPEPTIERRNVVMEEISCRIWAATYLVQFVATGSRPDNYDATLTEADRFNGINDDAALDHAEVH